MARRWILYHVRILNADSLSNLHCDDKCFVGIDWRPPQLLMLEFTRYAIHPIIINSDAFNFDVPKI